MPDKWDFAAELLDVARATTKALYPEARIPETPMPKWTPGPWQWAGQQLNLLNAETRLILAARLLQWQREGLKADKEDVANMSLIAAAPELYEALEAVRPYFEGEHSYDHPHCVQMRVALAKARGER